MVRNTYILRNVKSFHQEFFSDVNPNLHERKSAYLSIKKNPQICGDCTDGTKLVALLVCKYRHLEKCMSGMGFVFGDKKPCWIFGVHR